MRYLRSLVRHVLPRRDVSWTTTVALFCALAVAAAVPTLAGGASAGSHAHKQAHRGSQKSGSAYARLVHLRRLGRKPSPGTHSRTAALPGTEVAKLRTAQSRTFAKPDGTYVTRTYPVAVNFRDGRGKFQPIDNRLVRVGSVSRRQGYAFENAANSYRSFLPGNLKSPVLVAANGSWVSLRLIGADASGIAATDTGSYAG